MNKPVMQHEMRIERLVAISGRLCDAIQGDICALEGGHFAALHTSDPEIEKLSAQYGREVQALKASDGISEASPAARAALKEAQLRLKTLLARHEKIISAMRHVSEGMVQAVAEEVAKKRSQRAPYQGPRPSAPVHSDAMVYNKVV